MSATAFTNGDLFSCKIRFKNKRMPAWRRVYVPVDYTFKDLHDVIQAVMEWDDYHLHRFRFEHPSTGKEIEIGGGPGVEEDGWDEVEPFRCYLPGSTPIAPYVKGLKQKIPYVYDFGIYWELVVEFEKKVDASCNVKYPKCMGGEEMPPPEDGCEENERGLVFDLKRMDSNLSRCRQFVKKDEAAVSNTEKNSSTATADKSSEVKPLQGSLPKKRLADDDCSQPSTSTQTFPLPSVFTLNNSPTSSDEEDDDEEEDDNEENDDEDEPISGCRRCEGWEDINPNDFGKYVATYLKLLPDRKKRAKLQFDIHRAIIKYFC